MQCLFCINALADVMDTIGLEICNTLILEAVLRLSGDGVANVRFNVARTFQLLGPYLEPSVLNEKVKPCLTKLKTDDDVDVKYFANEALTQLKL